MKPRTWSLISLACFLAAIFFWLLGNRRAQHSQPLPATNPPTGTSVTGLARPPEPVRLLSALPGRPAGGATPANPGARNPATPEEPLPVDPKFPRRLRNTAKPVNDLLRSDTALLLRNALIDTANRRQPAVPEHLKADAEPGGFIVQARGVITPAFRTLVTQAGGEIVSYIPNNALLVRASAEAARTLPASPLVQAVLPFEPYYKIDPALLAAAVEQRALTGDRRLTLTLYPGLDDQPRQAVEALGAVVLAETRSPFGPQLIVAPPEADLGPLARVAGVQLIEPFAERMTMNDLTGQRMAVVYDTTNGGTLANLTLPLTGSNICINLNDTGVNTNHPDLKLSGTNRVFGDTNGYSLMDTNGHGTHVAGTIVGLGTNIVAGTNVPGSFSNAVFRGIAPNATLYVLPISRDTGPLISDSYLQEAAAMARFATNNSSITNVLISNNSWGYGGRFDYDSAAASYDAATRDALPYITGPQGLLFVFAAGNSGAGNTDGAGGEPGTIISPGTAKNVLTVGASELPRLVSIPQIETNIIDVTDTNGQPTTITNVVTNMVAFAESDSDTQVAPFSSRGNVGIGLESQVGRFKPDVVAPGTFVFSTWIENWDTNGFTTNLLVQSYPGQVAVPGETNAYFYSVPPNAVGLKIETLPNLRSPIPFPPLLIEAQLNGVTVSGETNVTVTPVAEGALTYTITTDAAQAEPVDFDLRLTLTVTNSIGDYSGPYASSYVASTNSPPAAPPAHPYRFDSGTSSAAGAVSGLLGLFQELFEQKLKVTPSPALLKALVINGARSLGPSYSFNIRQAINYQGWGLATLTNTFSPIIAEGTNKVIGTNTSTWPVQWIDQSATNALATGEQNQYQITIPTNSAATVLRVTLVWTDPPGNPAAGAKLVNDLDLELVQGTNAVYHGNDFVQGDDYTFPQNPAVTGVADPVNNVENIFVRGPLETNYTLRVIGRRVNVNAVTAHTNNIAQDYALVVSIDDTNAVTLKPVEVTLPVIAMPAPDRLTNSLPRVGDRVGANSPLISYPIGTNRQWHFYVFTNSPSPDDIYTNFGPNVAFAIHTPLNLSSPRNVEPDLDLYVSRDPQLLNLTPSAVQNAYRSVLRGASAESYVTTNATVSPQEVFYLAVKSEDQNAGEYSIIGLSSALPFGSIDSEGNHWLRGLPVPRAIPDGSPIVPEAVAVYAFDPSPIDVAEVVVSNTIVHEEIGDTLGNLSHSGRGMVLNNHRSGSSPDGVYTAIYDDSGSGEFVNSVASDGPGNLDNFVGQTGSGAWVFTAVDNAQGLTGYVANLTLRLTPNLDLLSGTFVTLRPNAWRYGYVNVPADASRMIVEVSQLSGGPVEVYIRRAARPTQALFDKHATMNRPGGELSLGIDDDPPLRYGLYQIGLFNPTAQTLTFFVSVRFEYDVPGIFRKDVVSTNLVALGDDVISVGTNALTSGLVISDIQVGLRLNAQRASDYAFYLVSPRGERVLLSENRGGTNFQRWGGDSMVSDFRHVALTYNQEGRVASLYLDGERIAQQQCVDLSDRLLTTGDLVIGYKAQGTNPPSVFPGFVDELDVYRRALTDAELRAIYKFGGVGKPTNELVGRWAFDVEDNRFSPDWLTNNPAELVGDATIGWPGQYVNSLHLPTNGSPGYVRIPGSTDLDVGLAEGFTLDAWINPQDLSQERTIAVWSRGTNRSGVELYLRPGSQTNRPAGELAARLIDSTGVTNEIAAGPAFQGVIGTNMWVTNLVFANFTDNTNYALTPIKFAGLTDNGTTYLTNYAGPGSDATNAFTNRFISGFERIRALPAASFCGSYDPCEPVWMNDTNEFDGETFGWWGLSNWSTVLRTPELAHTGTNLLALHNAHLSRLVRTTVGSQYKLQFAHRRQPMPADMVAWWSAEGDATDSLNDHDGTSFGVVRYTNAWVLVDCQQPGQGFLFMTNAGNIQIPYAADLVASNEWTIEGWVNLTNALHLTNNVTLGGPILVRQRPATPIAASLVNYGLGVSPQGVELWFNDPKVAGNPDSDDPAFELIRSYQPLSPAVFHHVAGSFRQVSSNRVELKLYVDGVLTRQAALPGILTNTLDLAQPENLVLRLGTNTVGYPSLGGLRGFNGVIDDLSLYRRALSDEEVQSIYAMHSMGKGRPPGRARTLLMVGGADPAVAVTDCAGWADNWTNRNTAVFSSETDAWQTNWLVFQASSPATRIDLQAVVPGALIDSLELTELRPQFFQPEEAMTNLIGQLAVGNWRLEVLDRRTGATNPISAQLIEWEMNLKFGPPLYPIVTLTNGVAYTNILPRATRYFMVNVPADTARVLHTLSNLTAGGIDLWFNPNGLPTGDPNYGDLRFMTNVTPGSPAFSVLATNGYWVTSADLSATNGLANPPRLEPGKTYYLGVRNDQPTVTDFSLRIDMAPDEGRDICSELQPLAANGLNTTIPATNELQYYCYTVPESARCIRVHLEPVGGNVNLYVRNARSEPPRRPRPDWFDYASENPGATPEVIVINQRSCVPLFPGHWYFGVQNLETNTVSYRLWVEENANYSETPLAVDTPLKGVAEPGNDTCSYYVLDVVNPVPVIQFDLETGTGGARLLVSPGSRPSPCDAWREDAAAPGLPARVLICTNDVLTDLRGRWYVAVLNRADTDTPFQLSATLTPSDLPLLRAGVTITNTAGAASAQVCVPDVYRFPVVPGATRALFTLTPLNGDLDLQVRYDTPPDAGLFDYQNSTPGLVTESIEVKTNSVPRALVAGDWYVKVVNRAQSSITYRLTAEQYAGDKPTGIYLDGVTVVTGSKVTLTWSTYPNLKFRVQYAFGIGPNGTINWDTIPVDITSTTSFYSFVDDGAFTGGWSTSKLYRLILVGP